MEIVELLKTSFSALKIADSINVKKCAQKMVGLSYALIVKIANDASKKAVINSKNEISLEDLEGALLENKPFNR
jgi:ATP-dependent Zn protease